MPKRLREPPGSAILWVVASVVTLGAGMWQWHTGGTRPHQGVVVIAGQSVPYQLPTHGVAGETLRVAVGSAPEVSGTVRWRPTRADEPFQGLTMFRDGDILVSLLPAQPAGGRIEYQLVLVGPFGLARIPADEPVAVRSQAPASAFLVLPYLAAALLALLVGVRAGLAALFARPEARPLTWATAACVTVGGLILGPVVQRSAFGAFWSGWPLGANPVDNGALVLGLAWVVAAATMAPARGATDRFARTVVMAATVALVAVATLPQGLHLSRLGDLGNDPTASTVSRSYSTDGSVGRPSSS